MLFVNEGYERYKYVVDESDNYVVLTNQRTVTADWQNPEEIEVIYQYIKPSILTIEDTRTYTSNTVFEEIETTDDLWYRGDCPEIQMCMIIMCMFLIWIFNALTKIGKKGGIFFGQ